MYDYVIVHGSYGNQFENWFPWIFEELSRKGKEVLVPQFPCGLKVQGYDAWEKVMNSYKGLIGEKTSFIGHSIAPAFIVNYLIKNSIKVKDLFLIAPFYEKINIEDFDAVNETFFIDRRIEEIVNNVRQICCYISQSDPYVPNEMSINFSDRIGAKKVFIENAGHFNKSAGYDTFDALLKEINHYE